MERGREGEREGGRERGRRERERGNSIGPKKQYMVWFLGSNSILAVKIDPFGKDTVVVWTFRLSWTVPVCRNPKQELPSRSSCFAPSARCLARPSVC